MPNLLDKAIRLKKKEHRLKKRLLYPKGRTAYILKRDGRTKPWTILAIFENFGIEFDRFRNSDYFEFAAAIDETFSNSGTPLRMQALTAIGTHIATVDDDGSSFVHAIRDGDEDKPCYLEFTWRFYTRQVSDTFDPAINA